MVDPKRGWLGMGMPGAIAIGVTFLVMGCASPAPTTGGQGDGLARVLGEISASREGEESVLRLSGLVDPEYSVTTREGENVVVVDLFGVGAPPATSLFGAMDGNERQIAVYDGVVDLVTTTTFEGEGASPLTRVEIAMSGPGRAEPILGDGDFGIRIVPGLAGGDAGDDAEEPFEANALGSTAASESDSLADAWAADEPLVARSLESDDATSTPEIVAPPATRLRSIKANSLPGGVLVGIEADGAIGALEAFTLADPDRLVIDLPGLEAGDAPARVNVNGSIVSAVRMGAHSGKVRIVLDGGSGAEGFQGRRIVPGTTGLWLAVGEGEQLIGALDDALAGSEDAWIASLANRDPQAESPASWTELEDEKLGDSLAMGDSPTTRTSMDVAREMSNERSRYDDSRDLIQVFGLHYERTEGLDRVVVLADDAIEYEAVAVDSTTIVVRIPGASISDEASDRIFPKAGGPISLIHAFQQPDVDEPEVRVVFTRAPNLEPVVSPRGSMLLIEFKDSGIAAAAPPAFAADASTGARSGGVSNSADSRPMETSSVGSEMGFAQEEAGRNVPAADRASEALPGFESGVDLGSELAALDAMGPGLDERRPSATAPASPAAVEVPAAIEVLEEGGLIDGKEYRGRRVSLDFKEVAIADVLRLIAEVSDLNIIAGDEVKGNVTIRLVDIPWDQALDVILMTKGLGFIRVGNVLRIAPSDVLKAEEEVRLQERRNKEQLEDLEVKLLPVNYAAVKDVEGLIRRLLSARGTVNLDARTNTVIIKDISSVIDEATALIAAIDTQTPQVMIEAKIVEANLDFSRELGSVWGVQTQRFTDPFNPGTQRTDLGGEDLTFIDDNSLAFANPITSLPTGLLTVGALILDQDFRVDAQIQAAESTGDGKVVSSPRIVTLDNKEAKIEQGVSIPFQTFEGGDAKLEFIDAVLSLVVTPHITADESIIMEIAVSRNAPDATVPTPTGSPAIAKNVAETETLVKDGQTLVLGGIYTIEKSKRQSRVPYLHRIPVLGNLFKSNSITDSRKELLVFVTPRIVRIPEMAGR